MKKFTNKELQKAFRRFNKDFFQKRIRIRSRHVRFGNKKQCCNAEGICSKKNFIYINEELKKHPDLSFIVLLHEMAHAVLFEDGYVGYGFDGGHGQRFYAELHRLYLAGALQKATLDATAQKMAEHELARASDQVQSQVRQLLHRMIDIVPGQLFRDVATFHDKFALPPTRDHEHRLPEDVLKFRIKFLYEELEEYCTAVGAVVVVGSGPDDVVVESPEEFDAEKALDALVDLCYVALGTAFLHRFPFNEAWARVQEANMAKVRAVGSDDPLSVRKHSADVVKPVGWKAPTHKDLLDEICGECRGLGSILSPTSANCGSCNGTGRKKRSA